MLKLIIPGQGYEGQDAEHITLAAPGNPDRWRVWGNSGIKQEITSSELKEARRLHRVYYDTLGLFGTMINHYTTYVVGNGFTISTTDNNKTMEKLARQHWTLNEFDDNVERWFRKQLLEGELIFRMKKQKDGMVMLAEYSAEDVVQEDNDTDVGFKMGDAPNRWGKIKLRTARGSIDGKTAETSEWFDICYRDKNGRWQGDVFYRPINTIHQTDRGVPELTGIIDFFRPLDAFIIARMIKQASINSVMWLAEIEGKADHMIRPFVKNELEPQFNSGSIIGVKKGTVSITPLVGNQQGFDSASDQVAMTRHVAAGGGHAPHWILGAQDVNRSSGTEATRPFAHRFKLRRKQAARFLEDILEYQFQNKSPNTRSKPIVRSMGADAEQLMTLGESFKFFADALKSLVEAGIDDPERAKALLDSLYAGFEVESPARTKATDQEGEVPIEETPPKEEVPESPGVITKIS